MPPISVYATTFGDFTVYGEGFFEPTAVKQESNLIRSDCSLDSSSPLLQSPEFDLDLDSLIESSPESFANFDLDDLSLADVDQLDIDNSRSCDTGYNNNSNLNWNTSGIVGDKFSIPDRCWAVGVNCEMANGTGFMSQNSMNSRQQQFGLGKLSEDVVDSH